MTKNEIRRDFRRKRNAFVANLSAEERQDAVSALESQLRPLVPATGMIAAYAGVGSEFDPLPFLRQWRESGRRIALPWFAQRHDVMTFRLWNETLEPGPFGIAQPPASAPCADPDIMLVPLVAVDLHGNRIGQGQGHYDRAIAAIREKRSLTTIALAWDCQVADSLPADPWDEPLDYLVTPTRTLET